MTEQLARIVSFTSVSTPAVKKGEWSPDTGIPAPPFWSEVDNKKRLEDALRILWVVHEVDFSSSSRKRMREWYEAESQLPRYAGLSDEAKATLLLQRLITYRDHNVFCKFKQVAGSWVVDADIRTLRRWPVGVPRIPHPLEAPYSAAPQSTFFSSRQGAIAPSIALPTAAAPTAPVGEGAVVQRAQPEPAAGTAATTVVVPLAVGGLVRDDYVGVVEPPPAPDLLERFHLSRANTIAFTESRTLITTPDTVFHPNNKLQLPALVVFEQPGNPVQAVAVLWWIDVECCHYLPNPSPTQPEFYHTGSTVLQQGALLLNPQRVCMFFTVVEVQPRHARQHCLMGQTFSSFQFVNVMLGVTDGTDALALWSLCKHDPGKKKRVTLRTVMAKPTNWNTYVLNPPELMGSYTFPDFPRTVNQICKRDLLAGLCRWECDHYRCSVLCFHGHKHDYEAVGVIANEWYEITQRLHKGAKKSEIEHLQTRVKCAVSRSLNTAWGNRIHFTDDTTDAMVYRLFDQAWWFEPLLNDLQLLHANLTEVPFTHRFFFEQDASLLTRVQDLRQWTEHFEFGMVNPVDGVSHYLGPAGEPCLLTVWRWKSNPQRPFAREMVHEHHNPFGVVYVPVSIDTLNALWKPEPVDTIIKHANIVSFAERELFDGQNSAEVKEQQRRGALEDEAKTRG